ncbi:ADP-ribosylglycohydrolase family protein [Cesiribacter sp. SM1]|uniref:ADP-ribosylglycohydrolase family protein n=1 Tax=Cesiribacter sp. SM1 TaxID=2861196 RepID=UPI001CD3B248|nr:ADP-ribosylglycohydrolase family protein [Cesiribacter sp. SM1]
MESKIRAALLGLAVGDALGVPYEFLSRYQLRQNPCTNMRGYGSHEQPPGTWSDDSALSFCLAEALSHTTFQLEEVARNFRDWLGVGYWSAHGRVFDIGMATRQAIYRLAQGVQPDLAGGFEEGSNGNGSLMRILPLLFYIHKLPIEERWLLTKQVSSITHAHVRSVIACFYYLEFTRFLLIGNTREEAYHLTAQVIRHFLLQKQINPVEVALYKRLLEGNISKLTEDEIKSSGYVVHTLEASIWCLLNTNTYADAVMKAVNLGDDTDTTAAVTGGLAGLVYGESGIPQEWLTLLARKNDIEELCNKFAATMHY